MSTADTKVVDIDLRAPVLLFVDRNGDVFDVSVDKIEDPIEELIAEVLVRRALERITRPKLTLASGGA